MGEREVNLTSVDYYARIKKQHSRKLIGYFFCAISHRSLPFIIENVNKENPMQRKLCNEIWCGEWLDAGTCAKGEKVDVDVKTFGILLKVENFAAPKRFSHHKFKISPKQKTKNFSR